MTPNVFKWTDFAAARGIRIAAIVLIALILNRLLRSVTRRLIPAAGADGLGRIARLREQHVKALAGLLYSAGTAVIIIGAILTALPEFGFNVTPIAAAAGLASLAVVSARSIWFATSSTAFSLLSRISSRLESPCGSGP